MKTNEVTTTIETEVLFMTDPRVEFVSLVKHGANRMPFKVLKSHKGGNAMKGIVQAVLLSKNLPKEQVDEILKDMKSDAVQDFDTMKKYVQRDVQDFDEATMEVTSEKEGVYYILGSLKEVSAKADTDVEKESKSISLNDVYTALYAMADMVSGTLRQENSTTAFKKKTVLSAIDNFKGFVEAAFESTKEMGAVKAEDHPTLVPSLFVKKTDVTLLDKETDPPVGDHKPMTMESLLAAIDSLAAEVSKQVASLEEKISAVSAAAAPLSEVSEELKVVKAAVDKKDEEIVALKAEMDALKADPVGAQSSASEPAGNAGTKSVFGGLFYKPLS